MTYRVGTIVYSPKAPRDRPVRRVTLHGTLTGPIWMPAVTAELPIEVDVLREAARDVSRSGLVAAIRGAIDERSGDFQSAKLTADSYVTIEHRQPTPYGERIIRREVTVTDLPSLADYVDAARITR